MHMSTNPMEEQTNICTQRMNRKEEVYTPCHTGIRGYKKHIWATCILCSEYLSIYSNSQGIGG